MKRIVTAAVLIPLVLLLIFKGPFWLMTTVSALVAAMAVWEYLALADASGARTPRLLVLVSTGLLFFFSFWKPDLVAPVLSALTLTLFVVCTFRCPLDRVLPDTASSVFGLLYVGLSLVTVPWLSAQENGPSLLTFLLCVVWAGDIAALYIGRSYGRHHLAPALSPNKTWEGTMASMAASLLITIALFLLARIAEHYGSSVLAYPGSVFRWLLLAVILNLAAQVGDLVESALKRGAGVKDSGNLLPGHGGVLDRMDGLLLAAPVLWYAQLVQQYF